MPLFQLERFTKRTLRELLFSATFHLVNIQTHEYNHYSSTTLRKIKSTYMPKEESQSIFKGLQGILATKHQWLLNFHAYFFCKVLNLFYIFAFSWGHSYITQYSSNPDDFLESLYGISSKSMLSLYWIDSCTKSRKSELTS